MGIGTSNHQVTVDITVRCFILNQFLCPQGYFDFYFAVALALKIISEAQSRLSFTKLCPFSTLFGLKIVDFSKLKCCSSIK